MDSSKEWSPLDLGLGEATTCGITVHLRQGCMYKLVVDTGQGRLQIFSFEKGPVVIGRGEDADLHLPSSSVSREHARIDVGEDGSLTVWDLGSSNGIRVNSKRAETASLSFGDSIQIASFTLIRVDPEARFINGHSLRYMRPYTVESKDPQFSTYAMSGVEKERFEANLHKVQHARLVSIASDSLFWYPEDQPLTFGGGGMVEVAGWRSRGIVAEVTWDGQYHVLNKVASMANALVNGQKIKKQRLEVGDVLTIGSTEIRYEMDD